MPTRRNVLPFRLDAARVRKIVQETVRDSARVFFTGHAEMRMRERRITRTQVLRCLMYGHFVEGPAPGIKGNLEMTMEVLSAGDTLRVVAALDRNDAGHYVVVVTTFQP